MLDSVRFVKVNSMPPIRKHLTANYYTQAAVKNNHVITKAYVDQFHNDNEPSRRDS